MLYHAERFQELLARIEVAAPWRDFGRTESDCSVGKLDKGAGPERREAKELEELPWMRAGWRVAPVSLE